MTPEQFRFLQPNIIQGILIGKELWIQNKNFADITLNIEEVASGWVNKYGEPFRFGWEKCLCKRCKKWYECGYKVYCLDKNPRPCFYFIELEDKDMSISQEILDYLHKNYHFYSADNFLE